MLLAVLYFVAEVLSRIFLNIGKGNATMFPPIWYLPEDLKGIESELSNCSKRNEELPYKSKTSAVFSLQ